MIASDVLRALERILDLESGSITGNESLRDELPWDSLAALEFMVFTDKELKLRVTGEQLAACITVQDLLTLVAEKISP